MAWSRLPVGYSSIVWFYSLTKDQLRGPVSSLSTVRSPVSPRQCFVLRSLLIATRAILKTDRSARLRFVLRSAIRTESWRARGAVVGVPSMYEGQQLACGALKLSDAQLRPQASLSVWGLSYRSSPARPCSVPCMCPGGSRPSIFPNEHCTQYATRLPVALRDGRGSIAQTTHLPTINQVP